MTASKSNYGFFRFIYLTPFVFVDPMKTKHFGRLEFRKFSYSFGYLRVSISNIEKVIEIQEL